MKRIVDQEVMRDDGRLALAKIRDMEQSARPPKAFRVERIESGIRVTVVDRGHKFGGGRTGAVRYDVYWAADVDVSSQDGILAGFARAKLVDTIAAPRREDAEASVLIDDPAFREGYFFVVGVSADGEASEPTAPQRIVEGGSKAGVVTHFQVSESGEEHNGVVFSALSISAVAPIPLEDFDGIQIVFRDYPDVNGYSSGSLIQYRGGAGGPIQTKLLLPASIRVGLGTITVTNGDTLVTGSGSAFMSQCNANDYLEIGSTRVQIASVQSDTQLTLVAGGWTGSSVAAFSEYRLIGTVRMYAMSVARDGSKMATLDDCPYVDVLMDGLLSAPNAPTLSAYAIGNAIRLEWSQIVGTEVAKYHLFRGTGAGVAFASCSEIATFAHDGTTIATATHRFDDSDFTIYQREQGQTFTYYCVAENVRRERSAASAAVEASCRLDGNDTTTVGRRTEKNLLYNANLRGTSAAQVLTTDTVQNEDMPFNVVPTPAHGHYPWEGGSTSTDKPLHQNGCEIILPNQGVGGHAYIDQRIDAWDNATVKNRRIDDSSYYCFSVYAYSTGGTPAAGSTLNLWIPQYDSAGVQTGEMYVRTRLSDDTFDESTDTVYEHPAEEILDSDVVRVYATFKPNASVTCDYIKPRILLQGDTVGVNVIILRAMLSVGTDLSVWTPELVTVDQGWSPRSGGPTFVDDGDDLGLRPGILNP